MTTRREFMKSAGAFAGLGLLPSWRLFKQRRTIDLAPFCDDDWIGHRMYDLSKPFSQAGMAYGTDGSIMCRTTLAEVPLLDSVEKLPAASELPWWEAQGRWQKWPARRLFTDGYKYGTKCPVCQGKGGFAPLAKCAPCGGVGTVPFTQADIDDIAWDGGCERDCRDCRGTGWQTPNRCDYCESTGWTTRPALQRIGSLVIAGHYDALVRALGDVEVAIVGNPRGTLHKGAVEYPIVKFRGDGFEGLMMPIDMSVRANH